MNDRQVEFFEKLKALLGEYDCEISASEIFGHGGWASSPIVEFSFDKPYFEFQTKFLDATTELAKD